MSTAIEAYIHNHNWEGARELIVRKLEISSGDRHWLLTRLARTYYGQRNYQRALELSEQAYTVAPECPLCTQGLRGRPGDFGSPTRRHRHISTHH